MKILEIISCKKQDGDIGLEIECEGDNLPEIHNVYWKSVTDSSLKRANSWEYVLKRPVKEEDLVKVLNYLDSIIKENDGVILESVRAGVHVHINVQQLELIHLYNFIVLYLALEELLVSYCGPNREGNLFCLRASDARFLINLLRKAISGKKLGNLSTDEIRYASINMKALFNYGSIEFRAMRSTPDFNSIAVWASMLLHLRNISTTYESPADIMFDISNSGAKNFVRKVLGEFSTAIINDSQFDVKIREGINNAQDIAFCSDWSKYFTKPSNNPFLSNKGYL